MVRKPSIPANACAGSACRTLNLSQRRASALRLPLLVEAIERDLLDVGAVADLQRRQIHAQVMLQRRLDALRVPIRILPAGAHKGGEIGAAARAGPVFPGDSVG